MITKNSCASFYSSILVEEINEEEDIPTETEEPSVTTSSDDITENIHLTVNHIVPKSNSGEDEGAETEDTPPPQRLNTPMAEDQAARRTAADYYHEARELTFAERQEARAADAAALARDLPELRVRRSYHMVHGLLNLLVVTSIFLAMVVMYPICKEKGQDLVICTRVLVLSLFSLLLVLSVAQVVLYRSRKSEIRMINNHTANNNQ
ncbi:hypothetical protein [Candidatus Ichthyocystis hellenicum]|uniref:hypothetical protein n=1 Tax=Candidatus Ichthyocystis hellenicum TaxID=1561003 RepID=UPI000B83EA7D|nr:hypothetical protein [Candidatus Ichthyocystis hellenicum]